MSTVLPTPAPTEQTILATATIRRLCADNLNAGFEHFNVNALIDKLWRCAVNRQTLFKFDGAHFIDRFADDVENAAEHAFTNWHLRLARR